MCHSSFFSSDSANFSSDKTDLILDQLNDIIFSFGSYDFTETDYLVFVYDENIDLDLAKAHLLQMDLNGELFSPRPNIFRVTKFH